MKASQPEQAPKCDFVDVQALGRDVDTLLKELQGITVELGLSRTKPFRGEDFPTTTEGVVTDEKDQVEWLEKGSPIMNYGVQWPRRCSFDNADHLSMYNSRNIVSGIVGSPDVTYIIRRNCFYVVLCCLLFVNFVKHCSLVISQAWRLFVEGGSTVRVLILYFCLIS